MHKVADIAALLSKITVIVYFRHFNALILPHAVLLISSSMEGNESMCLRGSERGCNRLPAVRKKGGERDGGIKTSEGEVRVDIGSHNPSLSVGTSGFLPNACCLSLGSQDTWCQTASE